jgi:putative transposase
MRKNARTEDFNPQENVKHFPLDEIVRQGAKKMLEQALEIEVESFVERCQYVLDDEGRRLVVRNGYARERKIVTGAGQLEVRTPRVDDRILKEDRFKSSLIPPYLRRSKKIDDLLPWLYLKGISTGDFTEALQSLLGKDIIGHSPEQIVRLKSVWQAEYETWNKRDLSGQKYVYFWVDGVYFNVRLEDERQCILVIIAARQDGTKELLAVEDGFRESRESWRSLLRDLKRRGLIIHPKLAIGDGALGFWAAAEEEFPLTKHQLCWVHKTANVLDKLPKSLQPRAKSMIHNIYMAPTKMDADIAFDVFIEEFEAKYPKATASLRENREDLMAFYDFPADHWIHLRTTNPVESTFATVRLRTKKTKGCGSRSATLMMVFKLVTCAQKRWKRLKGYQKIEAVMNNVPFKDGMMVKKEAELAQLLKDTGKIRGVRDLDHNI